MDSQYKHTLVNTRQKYSVPGPGFIWHVDTYHKLGNFGFVVFGVIDGFSHECICLDNDLRDRCLNVMKSLEEEYEGRRVQRAQSPFTSPEAEQIFIRSCIPIHDDEDDTNAYFDKVGDAFTIAKSL